MARHKANSMLYMLIMPRPARDAHLCSGLTLMYGWMSTSHGRRLQRRLSCSGQHRALTLEIRVEIPRPQVVEQGLQGLV